MDNSGNIEEYPKDNFFTKYFNYIGYPTETEASLTIHRWCAISTLAAVLGRQFNLQHGVFDIFPNNYIQIIGVPATRKSTAIKQSKKLLSKFGYNSFAPEKISLEKFLIELHELTWGPEKSDDLSMEESFESSIFGSDNPKEAAELLDIAEMYIASDEFVDFIGRNNLDFISLLGTLWDYSGVYDRKLKHSKAVYINNPTINIIAGNTPTGFNHAFPPDSIDGQGFFSRLLLIHAEPTGRKVTFPERPSQEIMDDVLSYMRQIKSKCIGTAKLTEEALEVADTLYKTWKPMEDGRFQQYAGRRFTHLLKLSLVCSAARVSSMIHSCDIVMANTLLTYAEYQMPKAMGHFGKGKNSAVIHKILAALNASNGGMTMQEILVLVHNDVDRLSVVNDLLAELQHTNKIQTAKTLKGPAFLPVNTAKIVGDSSYIKPSWLYAEEIKL